MTAGFDWLKFYAALRPACFFANPDSRLDSLSKHVVSFSIKTDVSTVYS